MVIWSEPAKTDLRSIHDFIAHDSRHYANPIFATQHSKEPNPLFSLTSACQGLHYNPPVMPSGLCATESWVAAVAAVPA